MPSITIVTPTFAPETFGTPLYTTDLARWMQTNGWDVQIVTAQPFYPEFRRFAGYGRSTRHDVVDGMAVYRLPTIVPRPGSARSRAVTDLNFGLQGLLATALRRVRRTDTVISVSPGTPLTAVIGSMCVRPGGAHLTYVHDVLTGLASGTGLAGGGRIGRALQAFERWALRRADKVVTLSPEMAEALVRLGLDRHAVSVTELWATVAAPTEAVAPSATLQYSGSLGLKQGIDAVFDLLGELHQLRPDATSIIRGSGPRLPAIREKVGASALPIRVEAPVPESELPAALAATPVHLVTQMPGAATSVLPSKVINALAVGGVVFALAPAGSALSRLSGECDAVVVADPLDPKMAAKSLDDLLDQRTLRARRQHALAFVAARHTRESQVASLVSMLQQSPAAPLAGSTSTGGNQ